MAAGGPDWFAFLGLRYPFVEDAARGTLRLPIAAVSSHSPKELSGEGMGEAEDQGAEMLIEGEVETLGA
eukprot:SAG31_NODE_20155_length_582_cov_0.857143_1_plen_68_part_10